MKTLTEQFLLGIRWNTIEACLYHAILWGYHLALFGTSDRLFYGTIGILFSLMYASVTLCTLGLDSALSPFIRQYTQSKTAFRRLLGMQCIPNLLIYGILLMLCLLCDLTVVLNRCGMPSLDQTLIIMLVALTIIESIKKTVKTFLGLLFYNRTLATLEVAYIAAYTATIVGLHYMGIALTLYTVFIPMFTYSLCITVLLLHTLYTQYCTLSDDSSSIDTNLTNRIIYSRFYGYINQLGHLLFSGNIFVLLFAAHWGVSYAAVAKIVSTSITTLTNLVNKIIGQPSEAVLAHAHAYASGEKDILFSRANRYVYSALLYLCIALCVCNYNTLYSHAFLATVHTHLTMIGLSALLIIEPLFVTYEKRYLIEEKGKYLCYYHGMMITLFGVWVYHNCTYPLFSITFLTILRFAWYYLLTSHHSLSLKSNMSDCNKAPKF